MSGSNALNWGILPSDPSNPLAAGVPTPADAWTANAQAYNDFVARERASGIAAGTIDPTTGWPTQAGYLDAARQFSGALIGGTAAPGSGSTQIAGTVPMYQKAIQYLKGIAPNATSVLDYGAGLGLGADAMRGVLGDQATVHTLEPDPSRWQSGVAPTYTDNSQINRQYDLITNTNVLNVLPQSMRDEVVQDIGAKLAPGGKALITTRGWSGDVANTKNAAPGPEPNSVYVQRSGGPVFQRGFTTGELQGYVGGVLGDGYSVAPAPFGKAGILVTRDAASASPAISSLPVRPASDSVPDVINAHLTFGRDL
ncbi:MAG TPA: methyltransferase domain-containing protein, partial [Rhodopila sp.]|nr:methyltransferase domain-containing protein [Rhodopila sp.]